MIPYHPQYFYKGGFYLNAEWNARVYTVGKILNLAIISHEFLQSFITLCYNTQLHTEKPLYMILILLNWVIIPFLCISYKTYKFITFHDKSECYIST